MRLRIQDRPGCCCRVDADVVRGLGVEVARVRSRGGEGDKKVDLDGEVKLEVVVQLLERQWQKKKALAERIRAAREIKQTSVERV